MTKDEVKAWLHNYMDPNDLGVPNSVVDCIMSQDDWQYVDVWAGRYMDAQFGDEDPEEVKKRAKEFALSALYECHDGPHLDTCSMKGTEWD